MSASLTRAARRRPLPTVVVLVAVSPRAGVAGARGPEWSPDGRSLPAATSQPSRQE